MAKTPTDEAPGIDVSPVLDDKRHAILFDLWVAGQWVGSRRTIEQCEEWLTFLTGVPIEGSPGSPW